VQPLGTDLSALQARSTGNEVIGQVWPEMEDQAHSPML
jgi:hypothetical protein